MSAYQNMLQEQAIAFNPIPVHDGHVIQQKSKNKCWIFFLTARRVLFIVLGLLLFKLEAYQRPDV